MYATTRHVAIAGFLGAVIGALLLITTAWMETSDAKPKKIVKPNGSCTCTCSSDERMDTFGRPPRYRQEVSGSVEYTSDCRGQNGGGCRIKLENGSYVPGTSSGCKYSSFSGAANVGGTDGIDPTGGNGPTQPFSRPGILLNPNP